MSPFLAIFILGNFRAHISAMNDGNMTSYIEIVVNKCFYRHTALRIPDINPNNSHIRFGWCFDDSQFGSQRNVIEKVYVL